MFYYIISLYVSNPLIVLYQKKAAVYLGGPPLVQMATGEVTDSESLGGADMHSRVSGVSDQLANDEYDAIRKAREWMANLNWEHKGSLPLRHLKGEFEEPYYNPGKILQRKWEGVINYMCS